MLLDKEQQLQDVARISGINARRCMRCGKCTASCPAFGAMEVPPHRFVNMVEEGDIDALLNTNTLWNCFSCFACVERCPRDVKPASVIEAVRLMRIRQPGKDHLSQGAIPGLLDDALPQQAIVSALRKYRK